MGKTVNSEDNMEYEINGSRKTGKLFNCTKIIKKVEAEVIKRIVKQLLIFEGGTIEKQRSKRNKKETCFLKK